MLVSRRTLRKDKTSVLLDDDALDDLKGSCREYTLPRSEESSHVRGWIRGSTKIGPVLDVKVCYHQGRCGVDRIFISSQNCFLGSYRERFLAAIVENRGTGKPVAKAKPRPTRTLTLSPVSIPYRERNWVDIEPGKYSQGCNEVSKLMIRSLRHEETIHREDDGAVRFDVLAELFKSRFAGASYWSIQAWISFLAKGGGQKKRFQYCLYLDSSKHFLYFRASQGHPGGTLVDPKLQDGALLPDDFADYIYHIGSAHDMHSIIQSGLIPGGKSLKRDRLSVIFTAVNPIYANQDQEEVQCDLDIPRIAVYKNTWRVHQSTV